MRIIIFFLTVTIVIGCSYKQKETQSNTETIFERKESKDFKNKLNEEFNQVDSTKVLNSLGCIQGYFAYVSSEYVLKIPESIYINYESIREYDLVEDHLICDLIIFKKAYAHLGNICTDLIFEDAPKPIRNIKSVKGKIKVFLGNKEELWGSEVFNAYIKIDNIEFIDSLNNNKIIVIKDKYLWKVLNLGTPG